MKLTLTPWYSGNVKPVRKGWYECKNPNPVTVYDNTQMDWWDGKRWCAMADSDSAYIGNQTSWKWRGVVK